MRRSIWLSGGAIALASAVALAMNPLGGDAAPSAPREGPCRPPADFTDTPRPNPAPFERLVSHEERVVIAAPLSQVLAAAKAQSLEDTIQEGGTLPHVTGTYMLTPGEFDLAGSRRITCLSDGSTLVEEILERREATNPAEFRYVVWNYTSSAATAVDYGVGRFVHRQLADGQTEVRWTYGFKLRRDRWPGFLGPIGDFLFRRVFLQGDYARMMQATLANSKAQVEADAAGD